jgi:drug/metabolite transporter (DMT)-like permease
VFLNLSPLGTAALAWFLLGESLSFKELFGVAIVIIGVTLVQVRRGYSKANNQSSEISTEANATG